MSSSSSASPSSSSSSSSSGCPNKCEWELDQYGQWQNTCFGCDPLSFCREPGGVIPVAGGIIPASEEFRTTTDCEPYGDPFPSSSSGVAAFAARFAQAPPQGMVRVPSVHDPLVWKTLAVNLTEPWRVIDLPAQGWRIAILKLPAGPATPLITPAHASVDVLKPDDKALCASVILPETGGFQQYWVPVLENYRWATLDTPAWRVNFLRLAMGP